MMTGVVTSNFVIDGDDRIIMSEDYLFKKEKNSTSYIFLSNGGIN